MQFNHWLIAGWWILTAFIFLLDILTPLGVAGGVPYVALVLLTLWSKNNQTPILAGIMGTVLTLMGFFLSDPPSTEVWIVWVNRILALFGIWTAVIIIRLYLQNQKKLQATQEQMQTFLEQKNEELNRSNQDLEKFAFIASHDLQEPLRKVKAFVSRVQNSTYDRLDEKEKDYLERSMNGAVRMQGLIDDLLTFSRVGRNVDLDQVVDLQIILKEVKDGLEQRLQETGGEIIFQDLPQIKGNKNLLYQLFQNLIQNALKFRSPERNPQIVVTSKNTGQQIIVSVQDNGIGIPNEDSEKVFGIFYRTNGSQKIKGSGLGLAICKKIAQLNGGKIWLESEEGKGTTFYIEFFHDRLIPNDEKSFEEKQ